MRIVPLETTISSQAVSWYGLHIFGRDRASQGKNKATMLDIIKSSFSVNRAVSRSMPVRRTLLFE